MPKEFTKDPDEKLDYTINWGKYVLEDGESITSSNWSISPNSNSDDLTEANPDNVDSGKTRIWVEKGQAGTTYTVENEIETDQNRIFDTTITIRVVDK